MSDRVPGSYLPNLDDETMRAMYTYAFTVMKYTNAEPKAMSMEEASRLKIWARANPGEVAKIEKTVKADPEHFLTEFGFRK